MIRYRLKFGSNLFKYSFVGKLTLFCRFLRRTVLIAEESQSFIQRKVHLKINYCNNKTPSIKDEAVKLFQNNVSLSPCQVWHRNSLHIRIMVLIFKENTYQRIISFIITDVWQDRGWFINGGQSCRACEKNKIKVSQVTAYSIKNSTIQSWKTVLLSFMTFMEFSPYG